MNNPTLEHLTQRDCADLSALLSLLSEHPSVTATPTLAGAVDAIQTRFTGIWESIEAATEGE
jgi:hypothetical protein